ncbi:MAG: hypothetical protein MUF34_19245 [Polyangiaceae bacterium]|nr:hypothetical protein [Polyangiaceae bacterium]
MSRGVFTRVVFAPGVIAALVALGALGPFPPEAFAQSAPAGAEAKGAGGAPGAAGAAGAAGAGAGGQTGGETSGAGGAEKQAPPVAEIKVVIFVEGPKAAEVRAEIEKSLPPGVAVLPDGPFLEALKRRGLLPLAKNIKGPPERVASTPKLQGAAQDVGAQAAVLASANAAKGGKYDVPMLIVPSDSPEALVSTNSVVSAKAGTQSRAEAIAGIISAAISGILPIAPVVIEAKVVPVEAPKPEPPKKVEAPKPAPPPPNQFVQGKVLFEVGLGTQGRAFSYIFPAGLDGTDRSIVRPYNLLASPHLLLRADYYPFAGPSDSFLTKLGLSVVGGGSALVKSTIRGQEDNDTAFFHFRVGPKVRFPIGADKQALITGEITYSHLDFTITDPGRSSPSFIYQSIRPGVGVRYPVGPLVALFEGGLHYVFASSELKARFPNATILGFDAQLGLALPLSAHFEGRFNLNYNRYRGNLKADLDSATGYVAAGSVDQFFGAHLGAAAAF